MAAHIEWLAARETSAEVIGSGQEWVGAEHQRPGSHVLILATDDVVAIEGTLPELRALAARITAVAAATGTHPPTPADR